MLLREDILAPIPGEKPAGQDLRYDPVYDKIKEARREDDELAQGAWQHERKLADHLLVLKLTQEVIAKRSKDLQLAAWLCESLLKKHGFAGLQEGLSLCRNMVATFWDGMFPELDEGDAEFRAAPLEWIGAKFDAMVRTTPLTRDGYDFYKYKESRVVGYEDQAKSKDEKTKRDAAIKQGKLTPEAFDKAFGETPKAFYLTSEKGLDGCLETLDSLDEVCQEKFGDVAPGFGKLKTALQEVRQIVHTLLQKKRETEPDPVEEAPPEPVAAEGVAGPTDGPAVVSTGGGAAAAVAMAPMQSVNMVLQAAAEPADRRDAVANVVAAAAFLRKREPGSPAPYLMLRGLRWGELRAAIDAQDLTQLEAPPTEVRRQIKQLSLNQKWADLIETAENLMALPCSRAWLDLQRFVVDACVALEYNLVAVAIRGELRAMVRDVPQILELTLMDDTPAANADTKTWLQSMMEEPQAATPKAVTPPFRLNGESSAGWQQKYIDPYPLAVQALRSGQEQKAFEILQTEIQRQRSGRGRFERRLQMVQLCVSTGKEALMQPMLDDLIAAIDNHKLEDWEDREKIGAALATIFKASKKIQGNAGEKQKYFERICRLDPVQALQVG